MLETFGQAAFGMGIGGLLSAYQIKKNAEKSNLQSALDTENTTSWIMVGLGFALIIYSSVKSAKNG